jgi:hypothetical protein
MRSERKSPDPEHRVLLGELGEVLEPALLVGGQLVAAAALLDGQVLPVLLGLQADLAGRELADQVVERAALHAHQPVSTISAG